MEVDGKCLKVSTLRKVYDAGYRRVCLNCKAVFQPNQIENNGEELERCTFCSCDQIGYLIEGPDRKFYICHEAVITESSVRCEE